MAQKKTRSYNPEQTRAAIIEAGLELFGSGGYHGTSVGDVAAAAGITKGAFYHHFECKEDLLLLIHDQYVAHQLKAVEGAFATSDSPEKQLRALIVCVVETVEKFRPHVQVFFQERRYLGAANLAKVRKQRDKLEKTVLTVIQRGIESGQFRADLDPRVACLGVLGMCAWTYQWFSSKGRLSATDVGQNFAAMILDGLRA